MGAVKRGAATSPRAVSGLGDAADFGTRLRRLRRQQGLSQADLAGADFNHSYVSLLESGRRRPTPHVAQALAARLGCTPEHLLHGVDDTVAARLELAATAAETALAYGQPDEALRLTEAAAAGLRLPAVAEAPGVPGVGLDLPGSTAASAGPLPRASDVVVRALRRVLDVRAATFRALGRPAEAAAVTGQLLAHGVRDGSSRHLQLAVEHLEDLTDAADLVPALEHAPTVLEALHRADLVGSPLHRRAAAAAAHAYLVAGDDSRAAGILEQAMTGPAGDIEIAVRRDTGAALRRASAVQAQRGELNQAVLLAEQAREALLPDSATDARLLALRAAVELASDPPQLAAAARDLDAARTHLRAAATDPVGARPPDARPAAGYRDSDVIAVAFVALLLVRAHLQAGDPQLAIGLLTETLPLLPDLTSAYDHTDPPSHPDPGTDLALSRGSRRGRAVPHSLRGTARLRAQVLGCLLDGAKAFASGNREAAADAYQWAVELLGALPADRRSAFLWAQLGEGFAELGSDRLATQAMSMAIRTAGLSRGSPTTAGRGTSPATGDGAAAVERPSGDDLHSGPVPTHGPRSAGLRPVTP